ncbi:hypothetical protein [Streptomyces sp. BE133]|uniref:hypothetical protein n=1 Tax=Streptomyces sp. BE133 TaxID=3002523 RepID=UPI002E792804|nr:hypothetical protein [Streptomyces sp. BE133]MEE1808729.1 hypothetical protein [Streptomyces sp. BE133]
MPSCRGACGACGACGAAVSGERHALHAPAAALPGICRAMPSRTFLAKTGPPDMLGAVPLDVGETAISQSGSAWALWGTPSC